MAKKPYKTTLAAVGSQCGFIKNYSITISRTSHFPEAVSMLM